VKRFDLEGGVVLLVEESHSVPLVSMSVATRSGALLDPEGMEGATRMAVRMLRRGCQGMSATEIETAIDSMGAELGADVLWSQTSVHGQCIGRSARQFAELFGRLVGQPTFPDDEIARLVRETQAEIINGRDDDRGLCERNYRRSFYEGHPYGRTVRGTRASVERAGSKDVLRRSYETHFARKNVVVALAGDVTEEQARALAETLIAGLPNGSAPPDEVPDFEQKPGRRLVFVDKPDRTQTQILIGTLGTMATDDDHVALAVANAVFGGTFTARLMKEVRSKRGWSYGASSRLSIDRRRQPMTMWTFPAQTDAAACVALEIELLETLVSGGITERELKFIQKYLGRSWAFEIDTAQKRVGHAMEEDLLPLPSGYYGSWVERVEGVTLDQCNTALKTRIRPENLLVTVVGTASTSADAIATAIPKLEHKDIVPFDQD
jgi:zinc protease